RFSRPTSACSCRTDQTGSATTSCPTSRASRCASDSRGNRPCRWKTRCTSPSRWPMPWATRTATASSTAMSSRRTFCCPRTRRSSRISASRWRSARRGAAPGGRWPGRGLRGLRGLRLPRISRRAALVGGGAVVVLGALGVMPLTRRRPALDPRRVVVAGFEDLSGDPRLAPLGHIAADWITQALAQSGSVEVVPSAATGHLDAADVRALAAQTGAATVVWGTYYREGDSVRFQLQVIDA